MNDEPEIAANTNATSATPAARLDSSAPSGVSRPDSSAPAGVSCPDSPALPGVDIADAAANPSSFSVEGLTQTNRPISDLIAADKYLRNLRRSRCRRHPLAGMVSHMIPPGTCDR